MKPQKRSRLQSLLLAAIVAFFVLLLLLRLFVFVHGRGHRRFHSSATDSSALPAVHAADANPTSLVRADRFQDGTPDFLRLADPADQAAFRQWFTAIADYQAVRPRSDLPPEITDCASLLRYAYREALKRHNDAWFADTGMEIAALPGEIRAWRYPDTPLGAGLFRVRPGSFTPADTANGAFAQFADAKTLVQRNAFFITRNALEAQPGDLLFYRQFGQSSPWHSMIVTRIAGQPAVVYHTGPDHGGPGELRRVTLVELLDHPEPEWRPVPSNPNFLGVYRWNILRGTQ